MKTHKLALLNDGTLLRALHQLVAQDQAATADLVAHISEVEARKLHLRAGYPSMFAYCVERLRMSEDVACKRIRVGRAARDFPCLLEMLADGRLSLSAAVIIAPHLRPHNVDDLTLNSVHKTRAQVEKLMAERFPQPDVPWKLRPLGPRISQALSPAATLFAEVEAPSSSDLPSHKEMSESAQSPVDLAMTSLSAPGRIEAPVPPSNQGPQRLPLPPGAQGAQRLAPPPSAQGAQSFAPPLSAQGAQRSAPPTSTQMPQRFALQVTISQTAHDDLRRAQTLLSHQIADGDIARVLERALRVLVEQLEKKKCAGVSKNGSQAKAVPGSIKRSGTRNPRFIPAHVKRAVWRRDRGQCTYVSERGQRCSAKARLELDHILEVARGGLSTIANLRLRCRAHNQYTAERSFGEALMKRKRKARAG